MGAALSLFVLMSLSMVIVRIASVALRHTGLENGTARFQALSAISGTGFTTKEAESVVNYPVRRRIIMLLMVIGNLGVITVMATVVVSFVNTRGDTGAIFAQAAWLVSVIALLWFLILNKRAERWMCNLIGRVLVSTTFLGNRHFTRLLQVGDGYSVCEHPVANAWLRSEHALRQSDLASMGLTVLAAHKTTGDLAQEFRSTTELEPGDGLVLYGTDSGHDALEELSKQSETEAEHTAHGHDKGD
jgi:hypothetical protein